MPERTSSPVFILQGIIILLIFFKVQSFGLGGDPLGGIVCKFSALLIHASDTLLGAKNGIVLQHGASGAVFAPALDFLSEQLDHSVPSNLGSIIHQ